MFYISTNLKISKELKLNNFSMFILYILKDIYLTIMNGSQKKNSTRRTMFKKAFKGRVKPYLIIKN